MSNNSIKNLNGLFKQVYGPLLNTYFSPSSRIPVELANSINIPFSKLSKTDKSGWYKYDRNNAQFMDKYRISKNLYDEYYNTNKIKATKLGKLVYD